MIQFRGIKKRFGSRDVLRGVDLDVPPGKFVGLIGASGSGKSTLARLAAALEGTDEGIISISGGQLGPATDLESDEAVQWRRRVGFVSQHVSLWPWLSSKEQIVEGLVQVRQLLPARANDLAESWAARFGMQERLLQRPTTLSGGERQRIGLLRALVLEPEYLILDEITTGLDPRLVCTLSEQLLAVQQSTSVGVLFITHQIEFLRQNADQVAFLHEGTLLEVGSPAEILSNPSTDELRLFLSNVRASW